ncbi:STAS/SEC14 domain-containing protein [Antarcticibacterium flavum]|uniref:STAS/SEC14 domain-containing protein n=1 Tax=Antarcticibacterium flavum TaxID=2058175 RepID=A0A5B7X519_9FLAO|nr:MULTISPECIES: STAS/SEC14 domain-containing protein [Antarcticibacterium]MCM4158427.1 hypothetical protein [Antarcticibacterium sp. W02-3]QCY70185.1 STAS/SEC14 domain-containing protein [Antarcticibacterium flavum]
MKLAMVSTFEFSDDVVGIMIDSNVNKKLLDEIHKIIEEKFDREKPMNLFVEIREGVDIPVNIILKDLLFKLKNAARFKKIAVVTCSGIFQKAMKAKDLLMEAEVEVFTHKDRIVAMNWIAE